MRGLRPAATFLTAAALAAACLTCNTPTLPIPPPIIHVSTDPSDPGFAVVDGSTADARGATFILALNQSTQHGVLEPVTVTGFHIRIEAQPGDYVVGYGLTSDFQVGLPTDPHLVP